MRRPWDPLEKAMVPLVMALVPRVMAMVPLGMAMVPLGMAMVPLGKVMVLLLTDFTRGTTCIGRLLLTLPVDEPPLIFHRTPTIWSRYRFREWIHAPFLSFDPFKRFI